MMSRLGTLNNYTICSIDIEIATKTNIIVNDENMRL
jgi:hypothetical protein